MAMTYDDFKAYLETFLWRSGDTVLGNNMDSLIAMADAELNRTLNIQRRQATADIAPTSEDWALPADFYQMVSVTNKQRDRQYGSNDGMKNTTVAAIQNMRQTSESTYIMPYYATQRTATARTLYLVGPFSVTSPGSFSLTYRTAIPDYSGEDASWVEDLYSDLYVYTILKHVAVFTREEERIAMFGGLAAEALASALDEDRREVQFGGSPLQMKPHRPVPRTRR